MAVSRQGLAALLLGLGLQDLAGAAAADLLSLPLEELARLNVEVATGTPKPLGTTPAAIALLQSADFLMTAAQTPDEALVAVPALHVAPHSGLLGSTRYFIRGIASAGNAQTLVMVNGMPMTSMLQGNSVPTLEGEIPIQMVKRIEVIRGPGSAVHGADAFAGVINIITKNAEDLPGTQAGLSYGSFDTLRGYVSQSGKLAGAEAALLLGYASTGGDDGTIAADAQTANDAAGAFPPASLAPGPVNRQRKRFDVYASLKWSGFDMHAFWREVWDYGSGPGLGNALDPQGRLGLRRIGSDLTWRREDAEGWDVEARVNFLHTAFLTDEPFRTLPPGAFGFERGVLDAFEIFENSSRALFTAVYHGWRQHRLRLGSGYCWHDLYESRARTNYIFTTPGEPPEERPGGMTDVSDTPAVFVPENQRTGIFAFAQDEWSLGERWELTTGLRYDRYSDFGSAITPRLGLVWKATPILTGKLLYGEAFRAPSFSELYVTSNPFALGNPELDPERLRSVELGLDLRPGERWWTSLVLYRFQIRDFIDFVPLDGGNTLTAMNVGRYRGHGMTVEFGHRQPGLRLLAHAAVQQTENEDNGEDLGVAPRYRAYLQASRELGPHWQLTGQINHVGPRDRGPGDPQPELKAYTSVDLTLRRQLAGNSELFLSGRNLFDDDMREPGTARLPAAIPLPGRSLAVGVNLRW